MTFERYILQYIWETHEGAQLTGETWFNNKGSEIWQINLMDEKDELTAAM